MTEVASIASRFRAISDLRLDDSERGEWSANELPIGWWWVDFDLAFDDVTESRRKLPTKDYRDDGRFPIVDQGEALVGGYTNIEEMVHPAKPPYIVFGDHTRCVKLIETQFVQGADGVKVLKAKPGFDLKYLKNAMLAVRLPDKGYSRHMKFLRATVFPACPLAEQRRIVAKLDSLTARTARARAELEHIPRLVEKYKQAILAKAFSGELTKEWRQKSNRPNWNRTTVGQLASIVFDGPFGSNLKSVDYVDAGVRVVRLENIGHMEFLGDKETFISQEKFDGLRRHTLQKSDILFSSFVADVIKVCLFPGGDYSPAINKADCFCIRVDDSVCDPKFLMLSLASHLTLKALEDEVHGATRPRISLGQLRGLEVAICDVAEQQEVIRIVETNFAWLDKVTAEHARASHLIAKLDQSILAKAFRGELVPQDPNDEPASVMLANPAASNRPSVKRTRRQTETRD